MPFVAHVAKGTASCARACSGTRIEMRADCRYAMRIGAAQAEAHAAEQVLAGPAAGGLPPWRRGHRRTSPTDWASAPPCGRGRDACARRPASATPGGPADRSAGRARRRALRPARCARSAPARWRDRTARRPPRVARMGLRDPTRCIAAPGRCGPNRLLPRATRYRRRQAASQTLAHHAFRSRSAPPARAGVTGKNRRMSRSRPTKPSIWCSAVRAPFSALASAALPTAPSGLRSWAIQPNACVRPRSDGRIPFPSRRPTTRSSSPCPCAPDRCESEHQRGLDVAGVDAVSRFDGVVESLRQPEPAPVGRGDQHAEATLDSRATVASTGTLPPCELASTSCASRRGARIRRSRPAFA